MELYNGNCFELIKTLKDESIDLVITSPPYANIKKYIDDEGIEPDNYVEWIMPLIKEIFRILKPNGNFILNINDKVENRFRHPYVFDLISQIHKETKFKMFERLFWNKLKGLPNSKRFADRVEFIFWFVKNKDFTFNIDKMRIPYSNSSVNRMKSPIKDRFPRTIENNENYKEWKPNINGALPTTLINICSETKLISNNHIAVYPEKLVEYFLLGASNENDLILDPFMGTGTTGLVCKKYNRKFIGYEIQKEYFETAKTRISKN